MIEIDKALERLKIAKKNKSQEIRLSIFEYERLLNEIVILQKKSETIIDTPKKEQFQKIIEIDGQGFK